MKSSNIPYIIIIALLIVLLIERCHKKVILPQEPVITIKIDTITVHDTIRTKPKFIKGDSIPYAKWDTTYLPDTTYDKVKKQYLVAMTKFLTKNYYADTLVIDSDSLYGWIATADTVFKNQLQKRSYSYNFSYAQKTITITQPSPAVRQLYFGGGVTGNSLFPISGGNIGVLYKDRQDRIFGANVGFINGIQYGISSYWKIKLK
jgi:hypothetical protein